MVEAAAATSASITKGVEAVCDAKIAPVLEKVEAAETQLVAVEKKVRDAVDMMGEEAAEAEQRVTALKTELNDAQLIQTSLMKEAEQRIAEVRAATEENEGRCEK
eukprot:COSAG04_NODE_24941_length_314_cov_1.195349_1_plen_104_part_11